MLAGGIEAGGTKFVCAVGTGPEDIRAEARFPTETPEVTISKAIEFFREQERKLGALDAIGIGSFGPVDPNPGSPTYGCITMTPKLGWINTDFAGTVGREFGVPVGFDTDVNAAALGEWKWGAGRGLGSVLYLTVGTGIGGGAVIHGRPVHGLVHPEMGHIRIPHDLSRDPFRGKCPYHGDCLEGLAAGPAIEERWNTPARELPPEHPAWELEAEYLALALMNYICVLSPERIVLGGGVMEQSHLFTRIRTRTRELLASYVRSGAVLDEIESYIVPPVLGSRAGVAGALALAHAALGA